VLAGGELAVSGRIKDLVIVAGRKHHAEDIETTIRGVEGVRAGVAVFGAQMRGMERPVAMIETRRPGNPDETDQLRKAIIAAVSREHDVMVGEIDFVAPGELPRTSSGKIRRHACRDNYLRDRAREEASA
jgi:acyl-CoA synthetase (AMP-forming)/AMP-acid ligase II